MNLLIIRYFIFMGFIKNLTFVITFTIFWILQSIVVLLIFINGKKISNVNYMELVPFYMFYILLYPCINIVIYIKQQYNKSSHLITLPILIEEYNGNEEEIEMMNIKENVESLNSNRSRFSSLINHYM